MHADGLELTVASLLQDSSENSHNVALHITHISDAINQSIN